MKINKIIKTMSAFLSIILAVSASISVSAAELSSQQNIQSNADSLVEYSNTKEYLQAMEDMIKEQNPYYYDECQAEREEKRAYLKTYFQHVPFWDFIDNEICLLAYKGINLSICTLEDFEEYGVIDIEVSEYSLPNSLLLTLDKHDKQNVLDTCLALMDMPGIFVADPNCILIFENIYVTGDVNLDFDITIADATEIQKYLSNMIEFTDQQMSLADMNGDGEITIDDATAIQKYLAEQ